MVNTYIDINSGRLQKEIVLRGYVFQRTNINTTFSEFYASTSPSPQNSDWAIIDSRPYFKLLTGRPSPNYHFHGANASLKQLMEAFAVSGSSQKKQRDLAERAIQILQSGHNFEVVYLENGSLEVVSTNAE
ncbi:hypothetical protein JD969_09920 [Planctomycetota bacterium]|nr:hypothetical protein JD969_09920 [Planctomycetota bacterium]